MEKVMEFNQFKKEIEGQLIRNIGDDSDYMIRSVTVPKNGENLTGFTYMKKDGNVGVTLYAENMYEQYKAGASIEQIVKENLHVMREFSKGMPKEFNFDKLLCKENIIPALIPSRGNEA